jgi:ribokinase
VLQLEIPLATVQHAIALCRRLGVPVILDPAPVPPQGLDRLMLDVEVLTPNQGEAEQLVGLEQTHRVSAKRILDPKQVGSDLLKRGAKAVVLKMGAKGAVVLTQDGQIRSIAPHKVKVADTTAAGDAFTGALAVGLAEGMPLWDAAVFANAAGALCCTAFGAEPSMPSRAAVDALIRKHAG